MVTKIKSIKLIHSKDPNQKLFTTNPGNAKGIDAIDRDGRNFRCYDSKGDLRYSIENTGVIVEYYKR